MSVTILLLFASTIAIVTVFALVTKYVIRPIVRKRAERKQRMAEWHREMEEHRARRREEKIAWNKKVQAAKRHLTGRDWRDPAGKEEFAKELFDEDVPKYLWYERKVALDDKECQEAVDFFWDGKPSFGDFEGHHKLRIRNAKRFTALLLGKYPLEQIGYNDVFDCLDEIGFPTGVVLFSLEGFYPEKPAPVTV